MHARCSQIVGELLERVSGKVVKSVEFLRRPGAKRPTRSPALADPVCPQWVDTGLSLLSKISPQKFAKTTVARSTTKLPASPRRLGIRNCNEKNQSNMTYTTHLSSTFAGWERAVSLNLEKLQAMFLAFRFLLSLAFYPSQITDMWGNAGRRVAAGLLKP